ncbi:uncharacterized protein LOC133452522 isoform X2 [Cololabis saira]|uniref:uncharacterized protein LOC133452522 isoform X2 n=1 Tax=Cololabis saira TaxID=129043 RepID=UPI002AD1DD53|nr:uncharacterized protein LOC133452522 isoform X2 [Cololabis saira]
MVGNMATCIPFQTQLSSIMEVLVKAAVAQISKLVDDKCAFLHLEISRKETENQMLKRKLLMMESKNAQLQRGFENFMDGRTDVGSNCHHPTGDIKFPEIEDAAVSFTIKEESPDEALWSSDPTAPACPAVQYPNAANAPENPPMSHPEASRQKPADFGGSYGSGQHGLQFTIKTEKEEDQLAFRRGRCQHGGGKQHPVAADFSMDERDSQLWSSIVEASRLRPSHRPLRGRATAPTAATTCSRSCPISSPGRRRFCRSRTSRRSRFTRRGTPRTQRSRATPRSSRTGRPSPGTTRRGLTRTTPSRAASTPPTRPRPARPASTPAPSAGRPSTACTSSSCTSRATRGSARSGARCAGRRSSARRTSACTTGRTRARSRTAAASAGRGSRSRAA